MKKIKRQIITVSIILIIAALMMACYMILKESVAWKNGWIASGIEDTAIRHYKECANELPNDEDKGGLSSCWEKSVSAARKDEKEWNSLSDIQKYKYPIEEFWKSGKGEPRRISKKQRERIIKILRDGIPER